MTVRDRLSLLTPDPTSLALDPNRLRQDDCAPGSPSLTTSDPEVAAALAQAIVRHLGERRYDVWFRGHTKYTWEDGLLLIGVPNRHLQEYLQSRFTEMMRAAASEVFGRATEVRFTIDPELFQAARREQQEHDNKTSRQGDKQTERTAGIGEDSAPPSPRP